MGQTAEEELLWIHVQGTIISDMLVKLLPFPARTLNPNT